MRYRERWGLILLVFCFIFPVNRSVAQEPPVSKMKLVEDMRQLASILENSHPDPYLNGGGKIAFNIRLHDALGSIPEQGMTAAEFYPLAASLAAQAGDAHTSIYDAYEYDLSSPGGIPLYFDAVGGSLFVQALPSGMDKGLIGSLLLAVEGVPFDEIVERQRNLAGCDNYFTAIALLAKRGNLFRAGPLRDIIPEWDRNNRIEVTLQSPEGKIFTRDLEIPDRIKYPLLEPESQISLPSTRKCDFAWEFLDEMNRVALLRITHMEGYREDFELSGTSQTMGRLEYYWRRFNGQEPPAGDSAMIAGIPSASETFSSMVKEMQINGTGTLIVDLRDNNGGNSLMMDFLLFFLYGKDQYLRIKGETATDITKLSELYFENRPNENLSDIGNAYNYPLNGNDYDLRFYCYGDPEKLGNLGICEIMDQYFGLMPSFNKYWSSAEILQYAPEKVYVLCNQGTLSGGYQLMWALYRSGAKIFGTPSGQAGNCFTNSLQFKLKNSGLEGQVSSKSQMLFPDDPEKGRLLMPDRNLVFGDLVSYRFDPNTIIRIIIDNLKQ